MVERAIYRVRTSCPLQWCAVRCLVTTQMHSAPSKWPCGRIILLVRWWFACMCILSAPFSSCHHHNSSLSGWLPAFSTHTRTLVHTNTSTFGLFTISGISSYRSYRSYAKTTENKHFMQRRIASDDTQQCFDLIIVHCQHSVRLLL